MVLWLKSSRLFWPDLSVLTCGSAWPSRCSTWFSHLIKLLRNLQLLAPDPVNQWYSKWFWCRSKNEPAGEKGDSNRISLIGSSKFPSVETGHNSQISGAKQEGGHMISMSSTTPIIGEPQPAQTLEPLLNLQAGNKLIFVFVACSQIMRYRTSLEDHVCACSIPILK